MIEGSVLIEGIERGFFAKPDDGKIDALGWPAASKACLWNSGRHVEQ
jgi:hypothetical protein